MDLTGYSILDLIANYSETIKELKKRGILRTKNVPGELGEFYVIEKYNADKRLPTLKAVPVGTKNINAIDQNGERYSIKSTSGLTTGVVYGLQPIGSKTEDKPVFEYIVVCKLDEDYGLEGIYQATWDVFLKHRKWHKTMKAWNLALTAAFKKDSVIIYEKESAQEKKEAVTKKTESKGSLPVKAMPESKKKVKAVSWGKTPEIDHIAIRNEVVQRVSDCVGIIFSRESESRYISDDRESALYVMSSKYIEKNKEYWYSIDDDNIPWLELFNKCYVAFAMGSADHVLLFSYSEIKEMMKGCRRTEGDASKKKKPHVHFSFAVEGKKLVYFKKKLPVREFVNVTDALLENWK